MKTCSSLETAGKQIRLDAETLEQLELKRWYDGYRAGILTAKERKLENRAVFARREREQNAPGWHSDAEFELLVWLYQNRCAYCWQESDLTEDHVIPLVAGGGHEIENILPACKSCNSKKGGRCE